MIAISKADQLETFERSSAGKGRKKKVIGKKATSITQTCNGKRG